MEDKDFAKEFHEYLEKIRKEEDAEFERKFKNFYDFLDIFLVNFIDFMKITEGKTKLIHIWLSFTNIIGYLKFKIRKKWYRDKFYTNYPTFNRMYEGLLKSTELISDMYINKYPNKKDEIKGLDNLEIIIYFNK